MNLVRISLILVLCFVFQFLFSFNSNANLVKFTQNQTNTSTNDHVPPVITLTFPEDLDIFSDSNTDVIFTVTDNVSVKQVLLNGNPVSPATEALYSENISLKLGENSISIIATDSSNNSSNTSIKVTYDPSHTDEGDNTTDTEGQTETITLPPAVDNLNATLIEQFTALSNKLIDIASIGSIEIANPPPIPEGEPAMVQVPEVEGLERNTNPDAPPEIPKGFSFASTIDFNENSTVTISNEEKDAQNTVVLVDGTGKTFLVGLAFFNEINQGNNNSLRKNYRFQTTGGNPLELTTTLTIPADASEGDATVSILNKNTSLASISLKVAPQKEIKVGKRIVGRPQIKEPIIVTVNKNVTKLTLKTNGKNFIGRSAIIDGKLERLVARAKFFTNITFVPSDGIKIKKFSLLKNKITLKANLDSTVKPGIKLFNIITPKGADIGAIIFPDPITGGNLEATSKPEGLILNH
ncbi:MAG: Ig-like domain-containing protein [Candidatus Melainabacteria bacterium]|nr:Ig-like domain-containing protein [Candidatus Melainabacteria bacterium]